MYRINVRRFSQASLDLVLTFYMCILSANKTGIGLDALLVRISLVIAIAFGSILVISRLPTQPKNKMHILWILTFWGYSIVSVIWAQSLSDSLMYLNYYISIVLVGIVLCYRIVTEKDVEKFLKMFFLTGIYTVIMVIVRTPSNMYGTVHFGDYIGVYRNTLGARMAFMCFISLYFGKKKKLYYGAIPLFLSVMLLTGSRKAVMVFIGGILLLVFLNADMRKVFRNLAIGCSVIFLAIYICISNDYLYQIVGSRLESVFGILEGNEIAEVGDAYRMSLVNEAIRIFLRNPFFGVGLNNYRTEISMRGFQFIVYSHNNYAELLSTLGIAGFLIYYAYLSKIVIYLLRSRSRYESRILLVVLLVGLLNDFGAVTYFDVYSQHLYVVVASGALVDRKIADLRIRSAQKRKCIYE